MNTKMRFAVGLLILAHPAWSQDIPELSGPFGSLVAPGVEAFDLLFPEDVGRPDIFWKVSPAVTYADGTHIYGATVSADFGSDKHQFNVSSRYLSIDPNNASPLNQWRFRGKYELPLMVSNLGISVVGEFADTEKLYNDQALTVALSYPASNRTIVVANSGYRNRDLDSGGSIDDLTLGLGVLFSANEMFKVSLDYSFDNDIEDENYTATMLIGEPWILGIGKNETYFLAYTFYFRQGSL